MKTPPRLATVHAFGFFARLASVVVFLAAWELPAQPAATNSSELLPASSPYGEAVVRRNIPYVSHPSTNQNFDLIFPKNPGTQPCPLIIWIHGGAWMMGFKEWDNVKYLVRHGYAIASIDYRFSQEATFPAQIQDCNAAMDFILAHATNYGVDPSRFVVAGGSAGGHLALLLGMARQEKTFGANPATRPRAIIDFFGPADMNHAQPDLEAIHSQKGLELFADVVPKLLGAPVDHATEKARAASPSTYVSAANPPILILHGGQDELVPVAQSERLHQALDQAGVKNELIVLATAGHDGPAFSTPEIQSKVIRFLDGIFQNPRQP